MGLSFINQPVLIKNFSKASPLHQATTVCKKKRKNIKKTNVKLTSENKLFLKSLGFKVIEGRNDAKRDAKRSVKTNLR